MSIDDLWYKNAKRLRVGAERDDMLVEVFDGRQPPAQRRSTPNHARAIRVAVVPGGSTGQRPRSQRSRRRPARRTNRTRPRQIV